jgi:hypothetical protein
MPDWCASGHDRLAHFGQFRHLAGCQCVPVHEHAKPVVVVFHPPDVGAAVSVPLYLCSQRAQFSQIAFVQYGLAGFPFDEILPGHQLQVADVVLQ